MLQVFLQCQSGIFPRCSHSAGDGNSPVTSFEFSSRLTESAFLRPAHLFLLPLHHRPTHLNVYFYEYSEYDWVLLSHLSWLTTSKKLNNCSVFGWNILLIAYVSSLGEWTGLFNFPVVLNNDFIFERYFLLAEATNLLSCQSEYNICTGAKTIRKRIRKLVSMSGW